MKFVVDCNMQTVYKKLKWVLVRNRIHAQIYTYIYIYVYYFLSKRNDQRNKMIMYI